MPDEPFAPVGYSPERQTATRKVRRKKRKNHGVLYFRNLRPTAKTKFKTKVTERGENMANVVEALMLYYYDHPERVEEYLAEVRRNRRVANSRRD